MRNQSAISKSVWPVAGLASLAMLAAAACGGDGNGAGHGVDAPPAIDGAADSPVTLSVTSGGAPRAGVRVYFIAADGTPVKTADTGADGTASAVMATGGSVTVLDPTPPRPGQAISDDELVTFMAVKPGDHLKLSNSDRAPVTIALTARSVTGATSYDVFTTCGNGTLSPDAGGAPTASGTVALRGCHGAADVAIVASKVAPQTNVSTPISGLFHAGVIIDGGAVNLVDPYEALTDVAITYTHAPAGGSPRVSRTTLAPHGRLGPFNVSVSGANGTLAGAIEEPAVAAASSAVTAVFELPSGEHEVIDWGTSSTPYALDLSSVLVRSLTGPSFDFPSGAVVWSETADGAVPDATIAVIEATRDAASRHWVWVVLAPHTENKLALPRLPTDVADWRPVAGDIAPIDHVSLMTLTGGYDALRAKGIDFGDQGDLALIAGTTGRLAMFTARGSDLRGRAPRDTGAEVHRHSYPRSLPRVACVRRPFTANQESPMNKKKHRITKLTLPSETLRTLQKVELKGAAGGFSGDDSCTPECNLWSAVAAPYNCD